MYTFGYMNQKAIVAILVLVIIAGSGYWYLTRENPNTATTQSQPAPVQQMRQVTLYHYVGGEGAAEYQMMQKGITSVPQIADATLKELFATYLPKIRLEYIGVSIQNGVATINFRSGASVYLNQAPAGISAEYTNSMRKTLLQFATITRVQFAIDGSIITDWDA